MESARVNRIAAVYLERLYRIAFNYCKNEQDASDAVQNAFLKLLRCQAEFTDEDHIVRWLTKVTLNECKGFWRSFWRQNVVSLEKLHEENETSAAWSVEDKDFAEANELFEAVMKLSPKYSVVIHLYYYEGYSVDEISEILGITPSNVQIRLMRARNKLKGWLKESYENERK